MSGSASSITITAGTRYSGSFACRRVRSASPSRLGADHVADESLLAAVLADDDRRRLHAGFGSERGLGLRRLHPIAADFDLLVEAAEELDRAVVAPAHAVTRPIEPRPRIRRERIGHELLRRQLGTVEITGRQPVAADVELTRHANGHGPHAASRI